MKRTLLVLTTFALAFAGFGTVSAQTPPAGPAAIAKVRPSEPRVAAALEAQAAALAKVGPLGPRVAEALQAQAAAMAKVGPIESHVAVALEAQAAAMAKLGSGLGASLAGLSGLASLGAIVEVPDVSGLLAIAEEQSTGLGAGQGAGAGSGQGKSTGVARGREDSRYAAGTAAMDEGHWARALEIFTEVVGMKGDRADAALYWKAYAQNKLGQRAEALATIQELQKTYANSRYVSDARALEVEVRGTTGQPVRPEAEGDDELKLLALNSLMASDSDQAIDMLRKMLQSQQSPKIKKRALFVLAQNQSPKARDAVVAIAKGTANPDLQREAIRVIGMSGSKETRQVLVDIYASAAAKDVKRTILQAYMMSGERDRLLAIAKGEADIDLRREAIRQMGMMHGTDELWQMYQVEKIIDAKREILRALFMAGAADRILQLAKAETDATIRLEAVRQLGMMGSEKTAGVLIELYQAPGQTPEVRHAAIDGLFMQGNAKALVELARKETNMQLKKELVSRLSLMRSKEATDFLMELINK